jgi:acetylornithine deacetylase/succinyl-diaminopimelate desuccinylase-like protein
MICNNTNGTGMAPMIFWSADVANNIHGSDEYVEISSAISLIKILAIFILDWCGHQKS